MQSRFKIERFGLFFSDLGRFPTGSSLSASVPKISYRVYHSVPL
jgi:hypothetical protein